MYRRIGFYAEDIRFQLCFARQRKTASWLAKVVRCERHRLERVDFVFCSDAALHQRNWRHLQHDTFTDVLTFDHASTAQTVEGDVYISVERVAENARALERRFLQELNTVMLHGLLHLMGYDDHTVPEVAIMRRKEAFYEHLYDKKEHNATQKHSGTDTRLATMCLSR